MTTSAVGKTGTWRDLLGEAQECLGVASDARRIVEEASGRAPAGVVTGLDAAAPLRAAQRCREMVKRRAAGEPLQYVLGSWGFRSLDLHLDPRVLIPRPETEQVVEVAL
ncbi:MAG: peptide chain release factor N(5)-glutamine methyltransferase, partial [Acidimicrobiales bacterium]